jgi:hypothetical protein
LQAVVVGQRQSLRYQYTFLNCENPDPNTMKASLITASLAFLFVAACEKKETTINTPPAEKKETVIVTPPAGGASTEKKTEKSETTVKPDGTTTEKKTETTEEK